MDGTLCKWMDNTAINRSKDELENGKEEMECLRIGFKNRSISLRRPATDDTTDVV